MKPAQNKPVALMQGSAHHHLAEQVRTAIRSEAYEAALVLLPAYVRALEQAVGVDGGQWDQVETFAKEAQQLLHWVKRTVSANRAHIQTKLDQLGYAGRYQPVSQSGTGTYLARA